MCEQLKGSFDDSPGLSSRQTGCLTHHNSVGAYRGDRSIVETLLTKGADVNVPNGCIGYEQSTERLEDFSKLCHT